MLVEFFNLMPPFQFGLAIAITVVAGLVKGVVGFAMPLVMISTLSMFMSPELALAGLILPTLVSNGMQGLRQGKSAAVQSVKKFRVFLLCGLVALLVSAQLVRVLPADYLLLVIGVMVVAFVATKVLGIGMQLSAQKPLVEAVFGGVAGLIGGVSGSWGPPTVIYLTALGTVKKDQVQTQGVIYGLGAVALLGAHIGSGILRMETALFSVLLVAPALIGVRIGTLILDRIDQKLFTRVTLGVLLVVGLNLLRRTLLG